MQNQESTQLSLFDFHFEEDDQVNGENELFQKNDLTHFGNDNEKIEENLLNEALQLSTSKIFELKENGNDFLTIDEYRRKQQGFDRVKELLSIHCINLVNSGNDMNSKNSNVVEELITILNQVFEHSMALFHKEKFKRIKSLGRNGQREFLLTKYLSNVESRILRDFVKTKKVNRPIHLYHLINMVVDYENLVSRSLNKDPSKLSEEELANTDLMKSMITSTFNANQFSQLLSFLNKSKVVFSHKVRVIQELDHSIVNQYKKDLIRRNRSQARVERMEDQLKKFLKYLTIYKEFEDVSINDISVWEISRDHLIEYKNHLIRQSKNGLTTSYSSKQHLKDIKTFFKRIFELNLISENIGFNIRNIQASDYFYRRLPNDDDMEDLFKAIRIYSLEPEKDVLSFALFSFLGFRIIELHRLCWEDINLSTKTIVVHSKGNKSHLLPIPNIIYNLMNQFPKDDRTGFIFRKNDHEKEKSFSRRIENSFTLYKVLADWAIEGGPHLLRHWFITNLARKKPEPVDILTLARHDSLKTTAKYIHYYSSELKDAINQINYEVTL